MASLEELASLFTRTRLRAYDAALYVRGQEFMLPSSLMDSELGVGIADAEERCAHFAVNGILLRELTEGRVSDHGLAAE